MALAVLAGSSCAPSVGPSGVTNAAGAAVPSEIVEPIGTVPAGAIATPARTVAEPLRPTYPAASKYGGNAAAELRKRLRPDPLRAVVVDEIRRLAREARLPEPTGDARLDAVADDLARIPRGTDLPPFEIVDFLLSHYGLVEAAPHLLLARASPDADREVRDQIGAQMPALLKTSRIAQIGLGVHRTATGISIVVALQEKNVQMAPVPRKLAIGSSVAVAGKLLGGYRRPEIIVTSPDGQTRTLAAGPDPAGVGFRADVRCDRGTGRYQIEVTGIETQGTAVAANFPVFCGVPPPTEAPRSSAPARSGPWTVAEAEARMLEIVNRDRRTARLGPVSLDRKLSDVARAHSQDMVEHDFVGHVSPSTGDAMDRARRAGLAPLLLLENIGRAYAPDEVQAGLMQSPGHRANILDPRVTRIGIGIAIGTQVTGTSPLLVTQLFI